MFAIITKQFVNINKLSTKSLLAISNDPKFHNIQKNRRSSTSGATDDADQIHIDKNIEKYLDSLCNEYKSLREQSDTNPNKTIKFQRINLLHNVIQVYDRWKTIGKNMQTLQTEMEVENDREMLKLFADEKMKFSKALAASNDELIESMYTLTDDEQCSSLVLEVTAGVGGKEAMLFAGELHDMYCNYIEHKGWDYDVIQMDTTELGGIRHSSQIVTGPTAFDHLKHEAGVHRVQRIPATEKSGRVHTSTVSVAVIPQPDDMQVTLHDRDLKIETKRASGAGGQHVNTTDSAVRIVHLPTGMAVECQTERSQIKNKDTALKKLRAKLCQQQMDAEMASKSATRKSQVGKSFRNEKIRTYNYNQDRITDHRVDGGTLHNLIGFLAGNEQLDELICKVRRAQRKQELLELTQKPSVKS